MASPPELTDALRAEYEQLFASCVVQPANQAAVAAAANRIAAADHRDVYERVAGDTGVPWHVVGVIHLMECNLDLGRHLHNGDPLSAPTTHVPAGRPPGSPPFTFAQSAVDALELAGFAAFSDWSVAGTLYRLEAYNGFGYRMYHPDVKSPYLWSLTNQYTRGKYGADGKFDPDLVSKQIGVAAVLRAMASLGLATFGAPTVSAAGAAVAAQTAPSGSAPVYPAHAVGRGDPDGDAVRAIQARLVALGYGPLDVDGAFGAGTEAAVERFQAQAVDPTGAPLGVDGVVGPLAWGALFADAAPAGDAAQRAQGVTDP